MGSFDSAFLKKNIQWSADPTKISWTLKLTHRWHMNQIRALQPLFANKFQSLLQVEKVLWILVFNLNSWQETRPKLHETSCEMLLKKYGYKNVQSVIVENQNLNRKGLSVTIPSKIYTRGQITSKIFTRSQWPSKIFTRSQMTFQNIHPHSDDLPKYDLFLRSPALMHLPFWPFQDVSY